MCPFKYNYLDLFQKNRTQSISYFINKKRLPSMDLFSTLKLHYSVQDKMKLFTLMIIEQQDEQF